MNNSHVQAVMANDNATPIGGPTARCLRPILAMLIAAAILFQGCSEAGPPSVSLAIQPERLVVRPGERLGVAYTITNTSNRRVMVVTNPDGGGGMFATKTVLIGVSPVASRVIPVPRGISGCPVGEGLQERHFHSLKPGESMAGHATVQWGRARRVPLDSARGTWRLSGRYVRSEGMDPRQLDSPKAERLWEKSAVVSSQVATVDIEMADWTEEAIQALGAQILQGNTEAARVALYGKVQAVWPHVEQAMFDLEALPIGPNCEFRRAAASCLAVAPFPEASRILLEVARRYQAGGWNFRIMPHVSYTLASFPEETVGPWAAALFNDARNEHDQYLALQVLAYRFGANDSDVNHLVWTIREHYGAAMTGLKATRIVELCEALGVENTRPILEKLYDTLEDTDGNIRLGLKEDIKKLLAQEDEQ